MKTISTKYGDVSIGLSNDMGYRVHASYTSGKFIGFGFEDYLAKNQADAVKIYNLVVSAFEHPKSREYADIIQWGCLDAVLDATEGWHDLSHAEPGSS